MRIEITPPEARVIGSLLEKEVVTPDQYPLSLSALTAACNQKSNRYPVVQMSDVEVQAILDGLMKKHLVSDRTGFGSRVTKYQHRFCNVGFGSLEFSAQELGLLCLLLLRGPQTAGELRTRTGRLCKLADVRETERVLTRLMERKDGPFVVRLPREPGKRELRYAHLFCGESGISVQEQTAVDQRPLADSIGDAEQLLATITEIQGQLGDLSARVELLERNGRNEE